MAEPLLKIVARFNIHEDPDFPLNGRAYLSACDLEGAYKSDLVYAVNRLRKIVESHELSVARRRGFKHTIAIMWGKPQSDGKVYEMIDFLGWQYKT